MKENRSGSPGGNPLGTESVGKLLVQFAIPSIISTLVAALYNMVDQIFIGQRIGYLGNAATTVAFPLTYVSGALTLLFSNGAAVNFNISSGRGNKEDALTFAGNGLALLLAGRPSGHGFDHAQCFVAHGLHASIVTLGILALLFGHHGRDDHHIGARCFRVFQDL